MNETIEDVKPVRQNRRSRILYSILGGGIVAAVIFFTPRYGLVSRWSIERAGEEIRSDYAANMNSLGIKIDSLEGEVAKKDSDLKDTVSNYNRQLGSLSSEHRKERERLAREYEKREAAARAELERARGASLDSFLVQYPGFDKNRDYVSSIGYWGSKHSNGALDFEEYVTLKRSLEFMLEGRPKRMIDDVLNGKALLMSGEVARQKTRDISVRDGVKYFFATDVNGNPKGFGMDFDQYEREIGGK